jgi:mono/diheme cytochrome c family protein
VRIGFMQGLACIALTWATSAGLAYGWPVGEPRQNPAAADQRTVWDGVYTAEQADRGKALYAQSCAGCHAADLRGNGTAPSLVEGDFAFQWADTSVGELYEQIRKLMPSDRPNSLPPQTYGAIVAYILQANQFPVGQAELLPELAILERIRITAKPTR